MDECVVCLSYLASLESDGDPGTAEGWVDHQRMSHDEVNRRAAELVKKLIGQVWAAREALNG